MGRRFTDFWAESSVTAGRRPFTPRSAVRTIASSSWSRRTGRVPRAGGHRRAERHHSLKRDVMAYCDVLDPMAEAIGSVNTLVRRADGKLYGYNTDAAGFCFMAQRAGIGFAGKKTLVLGSGGASRTAAACAKRRARARWWSSPARERTTIRTLGRHADTERIVNTTPVGMYPNNGAAAVDLTAFPTCAGVLDLIYNPRRTGAAQQAEELGIPCRTAFPCWWPRPRRRRSISLTGPFDDGRMSASWRSCGRK